MRIAVLIPVHNNLIITQRGLRRLNECLENLKGPGLVEIIIIDDGSTDNTSKWIEENYKQINIIYGNGNLWWTGAINKGAEYAFKDLNASHILLWNNDILPEEKYFHSLIDILIEFPKDVIICSTILYSNKPEIIFSMGGLINRKGSFKIINKNKKLSDIVEEKIDIDYFGGMGSCISREVYDKVGEFDYKNFPHYKGDIDFAVRSKKMGIKIIAFKSLIIWNDKSITGLVPQNIRGLLSVFVSEKSPHNIVRNYKFYRKHNFGIWAYAHLFKRYLNYIFGYLLLYTLGEKYHKIMKSYKL